MSEEQQALLDEQIEDAVKVLREIKEMRAALETEVKPIEQDAKARLARLLGQRGANWEDAHGYARLVAASEGVTYDAKGLDALMMKQPYHYGWLREYRKVRERKAYVAVK